MKHTERILKYLDGKLSDSELSQFREDLKKDPQLKEELEIHLLVDSTLFHENELKFRKKLKEAEFEYLENQHKNSGKKWTFFSGTKKYRRSLWFSGLAATIVLVFFTIRGLSSSPDRIYKKYYSKYTQDLYSRSSDQEKANLLSSGIHNYFLGDYDKAIADLNLYIGNSNSLSTAYFYRGISFMEKQKYQRAVNDLQNLLQGDYNYYREHSKWYLGLCYLKLGEFEKAKRFFLELKFEDSVYAEEAERILRLID